MRKQIKVRLEALKSELEAGETELAKVEQRRAFLRETMLRIGGAVQVLEELLAEEQPTAHPGGTNLSKARSEPAEMRSIGDQTDAGQGRSREWTASTLNERKGRKCPGS